MGPVHEGDPDTFNRNGLRFRYAPFCIRKGCVRDRLFQAQHSNPLVINDVDRDRGTLQPLDVRM